ncbi:MAG TPA: hypothetical protein VGK25_02535 [Ignavibacteria bacterium]|jgi:hypothetical protein
MKDTRLINILRTFSKEEMKQFEKFVASPYFNNGKNCNPLFKQLQKFYSDFDNKNLTYEYLYRKLYPGKRFNKQVMWNLTSAMEKMVDEFFIQQRLKLDQFNRYSLLLLELSGKEPKYYYKKMIEMKNYSDKLKIGEDDHTGSDYFKVKWKYEAIRGVYYQILDRFTSYGDQPAKKGEFLILSFIQNLTQDLYNAYYNQKFYNYRLDFNFAEKFAENINYTEIINYLNQKNFEYLWLFEFYYYKIMCLLKNDEEKYFFELKKLFENNFEKFTDFENFNSISTLTNYCRDKIESGHGKYLKTLFEVNNFRIANKMHIVSGFIRKTVYIQMVKTALSIDEVGWTKNFIDKNTSFLKKNYQKSIKALAAAMVCFKLKQYDKVFHNLNEVEFVDVSDKVQVKILLSQTYYELGEINSLLNQIDSAKHLLTNNKFISADVKNLNIDFFSFLSKLITLKENGDIYSTISVKNNIIKAQQLNGKEWLLEKLEELEKKK